MSTAAKPKPRIEPLEKKHDRSAFQCEQPALTDYLQTRISSDTRQYSASCYVALAPETDVVTGYYTLTSASVDLSAIPADIAKKLPRYPSVGATLLGRLARDITQRGEGLGEHLLFDALHRALELSRQIASAAVVTQPKDDNARRFYMTYGFIALNPPDTRLYLPMGTIQKMFCFE